MGNHTSSSTNNNNTGSKNRHNSGEDMTPPTLTATSRDVDLDCVESGAPSGAPSSRTPQRRQRASTIAHSQELNPTESTELRLPGVVKWDGEGKEVYVSLSYDNWQTKIPLVRSHGNFYTIVNLPVGTHTYKYFVDGSWYTSASEPVMVSDGQEYNYLTISKSDFDAFAALSIDGKAASKTGRSSDYGQIIPNKAPDAKVAGPPILPNQLLQIILNRDTPAHVEPTLLPEPNHVMLNHLYALSIKDGVMVLSATHRFRKKYVTTLLYKPIH